MSSGERCDRWIGLKVVTEGGETLGWSEKVVLDENSTPVRLIMTPIKWLPAVVLSTYELSFDEIVGNESTRNLWIAYEGAEETLVQLTVGWLDRLGLSRHPWEKGLGDGYIMPTSAPEDGDYDEPDSFPCPVPKGPGPAPLAGEATLFIDDDNRT